MAFMTRKSLVAISVLAGVAVAGIAGLVWSGVYNVGADDPHWDSTRTLLETVRDRSIDAYAADLSVPPDLDDPARIRQGAGNYAAMCTGCHLAPGMGETEMSKGLYPAPPDLTKQTVAAARAFWVIKHGIKASGMPAWGKSMEDAYIWNMAAFLQQLPKLDAAQYKALVDSSGGHSHGGGETKPHEHPAGDGAKGDHHDEAQGQGDDHHKQDAAPASDASKPHSHPPGTPPHDDAPKAAPAKTAQPHVDAPGTPPHEHAPAETAPKEASEPAPAEHEHQH